MHPPLLLESRCNDRQLIASVNTAIVLKYSEKPRLEPFGISVYVARTLFKELASTATIWSTHD